VPDDRDFESLWNRRRPSIAKMYRVVTRNRTTTIRIGTTVQASSICRLPYNLGRLSPVITLAASKAA